MIQYILQCLVIKGHSGNEVIPMAKGVGTWVAVSCGGTDVRTHSLTLDNVWVVDLSQKTQLSTQFVHDMMTVP